MTKCSKIVLEIVFFLFLFIYLFSVNRRDKSYMLIIQTVLGVVGIKTM